MWPSRVKLSRCARCSGEDTSTMTFDEGEFQEVRKMGRVFLLLNIYKVKQKQKALKHKFKSKA